MQKIPSTLQEADGTALLLWIHRNALSAAVSSDARINIGCLICIAYVHQLLAKPITCATIGASCGAHPVKVTNSLAHLVSIDVLESYQPDPGTDTHYIFTDGFTDQIKQLHATIVTVH